MEHLEFQIMLTNNYYTNLKSMHICFPMKIKTAIHNNANIDTDLITDNSHQLFCTPDERNRCYSLW